MEQSKNILHQMAALLKMRPDLELRTLEKFLLQGTCFFRMTQGVRQMAKTLLQPKILAAGMYYYFNVVS